MTHNDFLLEENLIEPVIKFQKQTEKSSENKSGTIWTISVKAQPFARSFFSEILMKHKLANNP